MRQEITFCWPHMRRDIERVVQGCEACQVYSPSKPREEMMQHGDFPTRAMSKICLNIFFYRGHQYLHVMDLYSSFIFTRKMRATQSTEMVIKTLESIFEAFRFLELIFSDSGPQMRASFSSWAENLGIEHQVSSAYFASSNGAIERSLKALKSLMKKRHYEGEAGLEDAVNILNAAPISDAGMSASRLFFGRPLRQPKLTLLLDGGLEETAEAGRRMEEREWKKQMENNAISRRASLELKAGDRVRMQSKKSGLWDRVGVISEVRESGRSANIKCANSNRIYLRNRIFLRKDTIDEEDDDDEEEEDDDDSANMAIIVCHAAIMEQPAKSALRKAWSSGGSEERERRLARRQLRVSFDLPACQSSEGTV